MIIDKASRQRSPMSPNASDKAQQILMVGDPGQIGPFGSADVSAKRVPICGAPEICAGRATLKSIPWTQLTGWARRPWTPSPPLYDFPFTSSRPDPYLANAVGGRVSEMVPLLLEPSPTHRPERGPLRPPGPHRPDGRKAGHTASLSAERGETQSYPHIPARRPSISGRSSTPTAASTATSTNEACTPATNPGPSSAGHWSTTGPDQTQADRHPAPRQGPGPKLPGPGDPRMTSPPSVSGWPNGPRTMRS